MCFVLCEREAGRWRWIVWNAWMAAKVTILPIRSLPKPGNFSQRQPFSSFTSKHLLRLADGEADRRGIDPRGLITPAAADFNERNPKKRGLIHLPGLLVLIESNYFICVVNIISWRSRSPPPPTFGLLSFWQLYRNVILLHAGETFKSAHGKFSEAPLTHRKEHLLTGQLSKRSGGKGQKMKI